MKLSLIKKIWSISKNFIYWKKKKKKRIFLRKLLIENLFGLDKFLAKMYEKDKIKDKDEIIDIKYLNWFTLLIFNLIRYMMIKEGRTKISKKKDKDEE